MKVGDSLPGPIPAQPGQKESGAVPVTGRTPFQGLMQSPDVEESSAMAPALPLGTVHKLALEIDPQALALLAAPPTTLEIQFDSKVFDRLTITIAREAKPPGSTPQPLAIQFSAANKEAAALLAQSIPVLRSELAKRGHEAVIHVSVAGGSPTPRRGGRR